MNNIKFQSELLISFVLISYVSSFAIQNCPDGEYWDFSLENCEKCNLICDQAHQRNNVEDCEQKCPGFLESMKSTTPRIDGISSRISTLNGQSTTEKPQNYMDLLHRLIIPGSVIVVIGLVIIVAIVMFSLYRPYLNLPPLLDENGKGPGSNNVVPQVELNPLINVTGNDTMIINGESQHPLIDRQSPPSGGIQETQSPLPVNPHEEDLFGTGCQ